MKIIKEKICFFFLVLKNYCFAENSNSNCDAFKNSSKQNKESFQERVKKNIGESLSLYIFSVI